MAGIVVDIASECLGSSASFCSVGALLTCSTKDVYFKQTILICARQAIAAWRARHICWHHPAEAILVYVAGQWNRSRRASEVETCSKGLAPQASRLPRRDEGRSFYVAFFVAVAVRLSPSSKYTRRLARYSIHGSFGPLTTRLFSPRAVIAILIMLRTVP